MKVPPKKWTMLYYIINQILSLPVPCTPLNVTAVRDCGANSITVSWTMNSGAIFYVAMAKDSNNRIYSCNSMDLSCKISGLNCATNYNITVLSSNLFCNSTESDVFTIKTGTVWSFYLLFYVFKFFFYLKAGCGIALKLIHDFQVFKKKIYKF